MSKALWAAVFTAAMAGTSLAQDYVGPQSVGSSQEQLYPYDDQEKWKHGYLKEMPYYHGYHSFKPYNYHHVFSQSQTASGWGMNPNTPYSQQFWHKYENMASPGSPMVSQTEREYLEHRLVELQLQQQAQQQIQSVNQFNGGSFVQGAAGQAILTQEVAPIAYQATVPTAPVGPLYSQPQIRSTPTPGQTAVQRQELRNYLAPPTATRR